MSLKMRNFKDVMVEFGSDSNWSQGAIGPDPAGGDELAGPVWTKNGSMVASTEADGTVGTSWWAPSVVEGEVAALFCSTDMDVNGAIDTGAQHSGLWFGRDGVSAGDKPAEGTRSSLLNVGTTTPGDIAVSAAVRANSMTFIKRIGFWATMPVATLSTPTADASEVHQANFTLVFRVAGRAIGNLPEAGLGAWA